MFTKKYLTLMLLTATIGAFLAPLTHGLSLLVPVVFGVAGAEVNSDLIRQLIAWGICDGAGGVKLRIPVAKVNNYQILSPATSAGDASGTLFTTRGAAGAVTFTLPAITLALAGVWYEFDGVANQNIGVAAAAGTVVTFNNAAAASVTASTAGGKIGAHFRAICDGVSWHVIGDTVGVTYTVA